MIFVLKLVLGITFLNENFLLIHFLENLQADDSGTLGLDDTLPIITQKQFDFELHVL